MADPLNLQILNALKLRLDDISVANGYNTDPTVVLGVQPVNADQIATGPVISIFDLTDDVEFSNMLDTNQITQRVEVEAVVRYGADSTAQKLSYLWQDINRAIFQPDRTLGGLALDVLRGTRAFVYPQPGGETVAVQQTVNVEYIETYGNP